MKKLILALLLIASPAFGQVKQSGNVTPGHVAAWTTTGVIQDGGNAAIGGLTSLGITTSGAGICQNSGPVSSAYNQLCFNVTQSGGGVFSLYNYNGASGGLSFSLNGTTQGFGIVALPVTINDAACIANSSGNLKDCGTTPGGAPGGLNTQLQYNNSGAFGGISNWTSDGSNLLGGASAILKLNGLGVSSSGAFFQFGNGTLHDTSGQLSASRFGDGSFFEQLLFNNYTVNEIDLATNGNFSAILSGTNSIFALPSNYVIGFNNTSGNVGAATADTGISRNSAGVFDFGNGTQGDKSAALNAGEFTLTGNRSAAAWTTNGIRYANVPGTLTDTSSSGTVATAYTNVFGGDTIAASSAATYTNYYGTYFKAPVAGTNATLTNGWALGADSAKINGNLTVTGTCTGCGGSFSPQGRLTLQTGTPVQTADQVNKGTIFYDCFAGGYYPNYNGSADTLLAITACQLSLTLESTGTGVENSGDLFDVWGIAGNVICTATNGSGGGWASDTGGSTTARGTGYSQLDLTTRSYITNKNSITHCYNGATDHGAIAANQGTYIGTFYTTAAGQTSVTLHPAQASGGTNNFVALSNGYNRVLVNAVEGDSTVSWTNAGSTWGPADASNSNRISFVDGLQTSNINVRYAVRINANFGAFGIDLDSTSATPGAVQGILSTYSWGPAAQSFYPQLGLHFLQAVENGQTGNPTFDGGVYTSLQVDLWM